MDKTYYEHDAAGNIGAIYRISEEIAQAMIAAGGDLKKGEVDPRLQYIKNGVPTPKTFIPVTVVGNVITGIPPGTFVSIQGETYEVNTGMVEFDGDVPGTYDVKLICYCPEYKDTHVKVEIA